MVSPLVKGTPDYRSGVLPSAANLQESANRSPLPGEPPDGSLKSKRSNGPVPKVASQPRTTSLVHRFRDGGKRLARKLLLSHQRCGIRAGPFFLLSPGRSIVEFQDKLDGIFFFRKWSYNFPSKLNWNAISTTKLFIVVNRTIARRNSLEVKGILHPANKRPTVKNPFPIICPLLTTINARLSFSTLYTRAKAQALKTPETKTKLNDEFLPFQS